MRMEVWIGMSGGIGTCVQIVAICIGYYIPRIRRIGGCYGFTSKPPAARRPPPAMVLTR